MGERVDLSCQIIRWISDEPQPGIVEATFTDAAGKSWVLIDKSAIFTAEAINGSSAYPRAGLIRCEVLGRRRSPSWQDIVCVRAIDAPTTEGDIESSRSRRGRSAPLLDEAGTARIPGTFA